MRVRVNSGKLKSFSTLMVLLAGFAGYAPSVLAEDALCSCMCTDTGPQWMCTIPVNVTAPSSCAVMACPTTTPDPVEPPPPVEPEPEITDPVTDATTVVDPPEAGLECNRRNVYRPDLGKYKTYKVCRPAMSDEQKAQIAEYRARKQEQWANQQARYSDEGHRGRHNSGKHNGWKRHGEHD